MNLVTWKLLLIEYFLKTYQIIYPKLLDEFLNIITKEIRYLKSNLRSIWVINNLDRA